MTGQPVDCRDARAWLSAVRDGEADDDPAAQDHLDACIGCGAWSAEFDRVNRIARLRAPRPPDTLRQRIEATTSRVAVGRMQGSRIVLALAAAGTAAAFVLAVAGVFGHSHLGSPEGREAEAFMLSLTGGYALTAWRPARLAAGFLPVAVLAAVVTAVTSTFALAAGDTSLTNELPHLPLILGAAGSISAFRATIQLPAPSPAHSALQPLHA